MATTKLYDPKPRRRRKMSALQRKYFGKRKGAAKGGAIRKPHKTGPRGGVYWSGAVKRRYDPGIMGKISSTLGKIGMPVTALLAFGHQSVAKTPPANLESYPGAVVNQIINPQLPTSVGNYWDRIKSSLKLYSGALGMLLGYLPGFPYRGPIKKIGTGLVVGTLAGAVIDPDAPLPAKKPEDERADKDIYRPIWSGEQHE